MFIRSLTLATLLAVVGPAMAADNEGPLAQDQGKARPLIVIAPSSVDPTLVALKKSLDEPANRQAFSERNMVLYTVINTIGQRDGKDLDPQSTMALIRSLKLGAGAQTKVILVGKDGEKKLEHSGAIELKEVFSTVDQLPAAEKEAIAPTLAPVSEVKAAHAGKAAKSGKPAAPPKPLDD
ncbi:MULTISPECIES: DUF4174 domain-containing protein [Pseudomonas]|uniref:DUF4174 domain-containing protein n=1 Tax=Pseudomonas TaxID=286 RepID=UPI0005A7FBC6|nr:MULTISPECIES: DUF4174 domain-containing protein [Pseudomonas]AZD85375.1 hypothetical protein C4K14_2551 [Pseudomonas chlororaphis subsp. aureofaciens]AZD91822.1 hypothetical protein C4K13_2405 [Pseudomonas chlororaphis subsp. aureofaciens]KAB0530955.1 DUF4174 domain-containing protein [Pseudomonas chlororaphis subsp. aureofaciens]TSD32136.1 DUF4174 domain-containing protein [Pseudomonas sp. ATCC 13985]WDG50530.1 DUF4174 domain-containing protein [Pseudomonas chlororaphis]